MRRSRRGWRLTEAGIITGGAKGAEGYTRQHRIVVASQRVTVVDTVGAGDTFNAGVLASLHEQGVLTKAALGDSLEAAIQRGPSFGGQGCRSDGFPRGRQSTLAA